MQPWFEEVRWGLTEIADERGLLGGDNLESRLFEKWRSDDLRRCSHAAGEGVCF